MQHEMQHENKKPRNFGVFCMQEMGLEPTRSHPRQILSLMRLPFRHAGSLAIGSLRLAHARFIISYPPSYCNHIFHFSHLTPLPYSIDKSYHI